MNLASLSIKRPIFITCIVFLMLVVGWLSLNKLPVDLFPNVTFPVVMVKALYPGAGPKEIETLISRPLEDEMSTLQGIKSLKSINREGGSVVIAQFTLETDIKFAEQQVRDRVADARKKLPSDIDPPTIRRIDPADQPIAAISIAADLPDAKLYDLANETLRPKFEQISQVGLVEVIGGRKRQIQVLLDRQKLKAHEISATQVSQRIGLAGQDIPVGKVDAKDKETIFRTLGEFKSLKDIEKTIVSFLGNDVPVTVSDVGDVLDTLEDEHSKSFFNGKKCILLLIYRQSGANTIKVVDEVREKIKKVNEELKGQIGSPKLDLVRDTSKNIRANVEDVEESILIGIFLTILVVFYFLKNGRSTFITGLALPNSLLGAFVLMSIAGFTINVMTLLALSLAVGLLVDDAIVVRENIFRHLEMGKSPRDAALEGTKEVSLAVIATTLTILAVFGPIAFLKGVVGQFFREFGLTICFAMLISMFDAFTMAPMLSSYFAGSMHPKPPKNPVSKGLKASVDAFSRFQDWIEEKYIAVLQFSLKRPILVLGGSVLFFFLSILKIRAA